MEIIPRSILVGWADLRPTEKIGKDGWEEERDALALGSSPLTRWARHTRAMKPWQGAVSVMSVTQSPRSFTDMGTVGVPPPATWI